MEQAVNTFTKALQMDTHPMVQGNDTLTDCLNGTFVTQNGNEIILQNDMGNRRVKNAYLPTGYTPVGIKEYGGIIYIAAYNPITNKSQLGSFPSPERNISDETDSSATFEESAFKVDNDGYLMNDTLLIPLTDKTTLHAGDKFVIYSNSLELSKLSNCFNTEEKFEEDPVTKEKVSSGKKIISPKNKLYTISIGILNSQNEFVDITKSLVRWDGNEKQEYTTESELYQFNDKYFIAQTGSKEKFQLTVNDSALVTQRMLAMQVQNANTYAYKLTGPLYMQVKLNHVQNFSYNIYGIKELVNEEEKKYYKATIWVEGEFIYNCPDSSDIDYSSARDDDYWTFDTLFVGRPKFNTDGLIIGESTSSSKNYFGFDFNVDTRSLDKFSIVKKQPITNYNVSVYDKSTNLYKVKFTQIYEYQTHNPTKRNYTIKVKSNYLHNSYIKELSDSGTIDLAKFGSGELAITGWRFSNSENQTALTYVLDAYPKYGQSFSDLWLVFVKDTLADENSKLDTYTVDKLLEKETKLSVPIRNGRSNIQFYWDSIGLEKRTLYTVYFVYKNSENSDNYTVVNDTRWFLTTKLFNSWYDVNNGDYTSDYGKAKDSVLKEKLHVNVKINPGNYIASESTSNESNNIYFSFTEPKDGFKLHNTTTKKIRINLYPSLYIENEELYPKDIEVPSGGKYKLNNTSDNVTSINEKLKSNIIYNNNQISLDNAVTLNKKTSSTSGEFNSGHIELELTYGDLFKATSKKSLIQITNVFNTLHKVIEEFYNNNLPNRPDTDKKQFVGITIDWEAKTGPSDKHYAYVVTNHTPVNNYSSNSTDKSKYVKVREETHEGTQYFNFSESSQEFYDAFNTLFENGGHKDALFTWIYNEHNHVYIMNRQGDWDNQKTYKSTGARLWWRATKERWAQSKDLVKFKSSVNGSSTLGTIPLENIQALFSKDLIVCMYKNYTGDAYVPGDYAYYDRYSEDVKFTVILNYDNNGSTNEFHYKNSGLTFDATTVSQTTFTETFNVHSSESFQDLINEATNLTSISNIDITTGKREDSEGLPLQPSKIYNLVNGELVVNKTCPITMDSELSSKYYMPLYDGSSAGTPKYIYDFGGESSDSDTYLKYDSVLTFDKIS